MLLGRLLVFLPRFSKHFDHRTQSSHIKNEVKSFAVSLQQRRIKRTSCEAASINNFVMADILKVAVDNLAILESIVRPSFGPRGIDVAMKTQTGSILVTNSGHLILNSLSLAHPIGRILLQQVERHISLTGDGSKEMVILLSGFLKSILQNVFSSTKLDIIAKLSGLSQTCGYIVSTKKAKIMDILEKYGHEQKVILHNIENIRKSIKNLLKTAINGKFTEETSTILIERLLDLIFNWKNLEQERFLNHINTLIDQFKDVCITVSGMSISNTKIIDGFLVKNNTLGQIDSSKLGKPAKFIIIKTDLDGSKIEFGTTKLNFNRFQLESFIDSRLQIFRKIANVLQDNDIYVVLCSHGIPEHAKSIYIGRFSVIQHVNDEDIAKIMQYFEILAIESMDELLEDDLSQYIGVLSKVNEIAIGKDSYLRLHPGEKYENKYPSRQLLLCSPHQSITQQYYAALLNMLKIIKMSCYKDYGTENGERESITYLPAAGCAEMVIAEYFSTEAQKENEELTRTVYQSLSKALMGIPKLIHNNSNKTSDRFICLERMLQDFRSKADDDICFSFGIDSDGGQIFEPCKHDIIEPLSSKLLLISHVLQVAQQILRIEKILPAKRITENENEATIMVNDLEL